MQTTTNNELLNLSRNEEDPLNQSGRKSSSNQKSTKKKFYLEKKDVYRLILAIIMNIVFWITVKVVD